MLKKDQGDIYDNEIPMTGWQNLPEEITLTHLSYGKSTIMERSVAISGYLFGHNPFIQPGVEDYKKAMFAMLGKPGFEKKGKEIKDRIRKMKRVRI